MRIIAGKQRGRLLAQPPQTITRPTTDRVREALFSTLTSRIHTFEGMRVLDAFAGSGALGLEALSRGAMHVTFAEKNLHARRVLMHNILTLECANSVVVHNDIFKLTHVEFPFDLIFLDPPYGANLEHDLALSLIKSGAVNQSTLIICETQSRSVPAALATLTCIDIKHYGNCALSFWIKF